MECITLYATFASKVEAERIIDALLEAKLIACANLFTEITSYYNWQGKREQSTEIAVILKTIDKRQSYAIDMIVKMHSYDCPCVTVWPVSSGHEQYLEWIKNETLLP